MATENYNATIVGQVKGAQSFCDLVLNFKKNFLERDVEIVPGLLFNQYETIKRTYFYLHNQFESGPTDENGEPKYFYDMMTDRNDQMTKNIELDTKDIYIKSESGGSYLKSWLLRREYMAYAKETGFGKKLNEIADDMPDFGTVVWKKILDDDGRVDVTEVDLVNLMNDPIAKKLSDGTVIERHVLSQEELRKKAKVWGQDKVDRLIRTVKPVSRTRFMTSNGNLGSARTFNTVDESTPYYELYEFWGEIPKYLYDKYKPEEEEAEDGSVSVVKYAGKPVASGIPKNPEQNQNLSHETVYVMAIISGIETGSTENVVFCKKTSKKAFPYKEAHGRRRKGRWLGIGNYELCFDLIEKANEITNRYFGSLRLALLHIYQTREKNHIKNVLTDLLDGDVVVTRSELTALPTEIRGANEYKNEMASIEAKVDRLCNSFEVVTGANLPSGTPFKLGQQQLQSATSLFKYMQENIGLFLEEVFNEWLLPDFASWLSKEHILDLVDDVDDIEMYYDAKRKMLQYQMLKEYIMQNNEMPDPGQLQTVGELVKDQIAKSPKQVLMEKDYYANQKYSLKTVITGENDAKAENLETLGNMFQVIAANPAALQDPRLMKIFNLIMEQSGYSPLQLNAINQTPTNPLLNPGNQGGGGVERSMAENQPADVGSPPAQMGAEAMASAA